MSRFVGKGVAMNSNTTMSPQRHTAMSLLIEKARRQQAEFRVSCVELRQYINDYDLQADAEQILGKELARYV